MKFNLNAKNPSSNQLHFFFKKDNVKNFTFCSPFPEGIKKSLLQILKTEGEEMDFGETFFFRNQGRGHHLCISLGKRESINHEEVRELFGRIYKKLQLEKVFDFTLSLDFFPFSEKTQGFKAMVESLVMSNYQFDKFKKAGKAKTDFKVFFQVKKEGGSFKKHLIESEIVAKGVNFARYLGDCPGNFMTPHQMGEEAKKSAKDTKMKVTVWNKARIAKEKMDSLIGVSNGSDQEPRFVIMEYKGAASSKKTHLFCG